MDQLYGEWVGHVSAEPALGIVEPPRGRLWLLDAAELLGEADPGPTRWLVEGLIVDRAIVAMVGRWKTLKSFVLLHVCISIAVGERAFGQLRIPEPGPVVFVNEESGLAAMWRRLDSLCRGQAVERDLLRERLYVAPNARVKLDDPGWQQELLAIGHELRPRLFAFDPLARLKAPARDENAQKEMAPVIEFLRELRGKTDAAVGFVHHQGHAGDHMRGISDLESVWETRLTWKREAASRLVTIESQHREAESGEPLKFRVISDADARSMRFELLREGDVRRDYEAEIAVWLPDHLRSSTNEIATGIRAGKKAVADTLNASPLFDFEPGPNRSKLWVPSKPRNHTGNPEAPVASVGSPSALLEGTEGTTTTGSLTLATPTNSPSSKSAPTSSPEEA